MRFRNALRVCLLMFATACGESSSPTSSSTTRPACTFVLSPKTQSIPRSGGTFAATLTMAEAGCAWIAAADAPWITITAGTAGNATATIAYAVPENPDGVRTGNIVVRFVDASASLTVTQDGR